MTAKLPTLPSQAGQPHVPTVPAAQVALPWWRYSHVWLVVGGPAVVVVASIATLALALRWPDPVLAGDAYRQGVRVDAARAATGEAARALMPALQGRDHAVSPAPPAALSTPGAPAAR